MPCWLCEYHDDPIARNVARFMRESSVVMGPELMAERVHESLVEHCPEAPGISLDEVREHIMTHTLCPAVRVGCILRSLLKLTDRLEGMSSTRDEDTGAPSVDRRNVLVYLKVVSEVMQMYKTGEVSKLLFAQEAKP
jgi:hypothetical protein